MTNFNGRIAEILETQGYAGKVYTNRKLAALIVAEVDKWYVPRSFRIDPEGYPE